MNICYINNNIEVVGNPEDIEGFKKDATPESFGYVGEFENTEYKMVENNDGSLTISMRLFDVVGSTYVEELGKKYPNLDIFLEWVDIHGSIYGYLTMEKGVKTSEDSLFNDYICCNCCEYNEDCECVFDNS